MDKVLDILVIGGGINGAGIARDAAGRGLNVLLCEQSDLASATSSASTKLIHGGLRYLEHYAFGLVRESLIEREVLLQAAPHIIKPMRFVLPHHQGLRPLFLIRLGLFLYDHLGGRKILPASKRIHLSRENAGAPLKPQFKHGFEYSDCWVDDARLVVLNALSAQEKGAQILTRTKCVSARRVQGAWEVVLEKADGEQVIVKAKALVNAAGPWVADVYDEVAGSHRRDKSVRLVKGSHIVVTQRFEGEHAYLFQHEDGRVVFAIPFLEDLTLIGTTDIAYDDNPDSVAASDEEIQYLCDVANEYFTEPVRREDVVWSYSGVRPLYDDGSENASAVTREYVLDLNKPNGEAPLLSVFGGKITTYRQLAEQVLENLQPSLGFTAPAWTCGETLPGGDIPNADFQLFYTAMAAFYPWLSECLLARLLRAYGTRIDLILGQANSLEDLGEAFSAELYEAELAYLKRYEWATCADDVLWRRTKLGVHLSESAREKVAEWFSKSSENVSTTKQRVC